MPELLRSSASGRVLFFPLPGCRPCEASVFPVLSVSDAYLSPFRGGLDNLVAVKCVLIHSCANYTIKLYFCQSYEFFVNKKKRVILLSNLFLLCLYFLSIHLFLRMVYYQKNQFALKMATDVATQLCGEVDL